MHGIRLIAVSSLMAASTAWADSDPRYFDSASSGLTWDNSSTANWGVVSGGPYSSVFGSYNNAIFEGTGDTITNNGVHVNGLIFNADGYVIQGGTVTIGSPATGRYITVADGVTGTIASNLGKNGVARPLIKNGSGTLSITGATSSLDALEIHDGTFRFAGGTMTIAGDVRLGNTATDSTSVFSMEGGTVNITGGNHIFANNSKSSAIFIQTGGTFNIGGSGYLYMGNLAAPIQTVTISGGVFNATTTGPQYLAIRGDASITVNGTGAATFRNLYFGHPSVGGNGVVHLDGGTLTLSSLGLNNGTGVFNFNGGLLKVAATTASFMAGITRANIRDGGARIETPSVNATIAQALVHSNIAGDAAVDGGLTKTGSGRLTLTSGSNSYNGPTSIQQGTLEITAVGALPTASAVTISPGATLLHTINGAAIPNNVSGAGSWTLAVTSGTLNNFTLKGDNSGFDGTLTLKSGARLIVGSSQTPSASMPGATSTIVVENGAALYLTTGTGSVASSLIIRGNGPTENSPGPYGALRVDSGSVYAGDISLAADARIGSQSGNGTVGGNVSVGGHALTLNTAGSNLYFTGNLTATAAGSITKMGNYTADFSGDNSNLMGTVTVQQSNLFLSSTTASSAAAAWVVTGGTLSSALGGDPVHHLGSLAGSGGRVGTITGNTQATFVVGERGENTTYSGQIVDSTGSGNGTTALTKTGTGSLTLAGSNTYSGLTLVQEGSLMVTGSTLPAGMIQVSAGATLGGNGAVGMVAVDDFGVLSPGQGSNNHFTVESLDLNPESILAFDLAAPLANPYDIFPDAMSDHIQINQALTLDGFLRIQPLSGFGSPQVGDRWLLMSASGGVADATLEVDSSNAPVLDPGLSYTIDSTSNPGYVYLAIVPEAGTSGLVFLGLLLVLRRKITRKSLSPE